MEELRSTKANKIERVKGLRHHCKARTCVAVLALRNVKERIMWKGPSCDVKERKKQDEWRNEEVYIAESSAI